MKHMVRGFVCLAFAAGVSFTASATTYHVTPGATAGSGDGLSWGSPVTLTEAIAKAANDDVILCKAGVYPTTAANGKAAYSISRPLVVRGGLKGSDDATLDTDFPYSTFSNTVATASMIEVKTGTATNTNRFENIVFTGMNSSGIYTACALIKSGAGSIVLENCRFVNNKAAAGDARLLPVAANLTGSSDSVAILANCRFEGNIRTGASDVRGHALYASTFREVVLENCSFVTNGLLWTATSQAATTRLGVTAAAVYVTGAKVTAKNCAFVGNRAAWINATDGGCVRLDGNCGGSSFENCRFVGNCETFGYLFDKNYATKPPFGTAGGALVFNPSANDAELTVKGCTIALNLSDSTASAAGITVRAGHLNLQDSIVANNLRADYDSVGADLCVLSGASATISNSMLSADAPQSWTICGQTATTFDRATMRFGDPLFTTPLADVRSMVLLFGSYYYKHPYFNATLAARDEVVAFDVHLTEESPALGLGAYAAAGDDPALPTGTPAFGTLTMSFPEPYTDPHVMVPMAGSDPYLASVEVVLKVGGEKIASRTFAGVRKGDVLTFAPPLGLEPGTPVTAEATAKAFGQTDVLAVPVTESAPAEATKAPWCGVAGVNGVIYVREGATGAATGRSWADAYPNFETGFNDLTAGRPELWVSGFHMLTNRLYLGSPMAPMAIRGGFAGHETTADDRLADHSRAVVDGAELFQGITVSNPEAMTMTFERLSFERMVDGAIIKTGAGDIDVSDCRFFQCGYRQMGNVGVVYDGFGMNLSGTSEASANIQDCLFEGCLSSQLNLNQKGAVLQVSTFKNVAMSDCLFLTNGIPWQDSLNNWSMVFSMVYVTGAPISVSRCRFIGNRVTTRGSAGCFYLTGACDGSVFDHCLWTANAASHTGVRGPGEYSSTASLVVSLANAADAVSVTGCTMAYNLADGTKAAGGLSVVKGAVTIRDSIFYGNGRTTGGTSGNDLAVWSNGSADIAYSIFTAKPGTYDSITTATAENLTIDDATTLFADDGYDPLFVTSLATAQGYFTITRDNCRAFKEADKQAVCNFDLHIKSPGGYWLNDGTLVKDAETPTSSALDSGDPASDFSNEPEPNGGCVNMGFYGNSTNASMTVAAELEVTDVRTTYPTNWSRPHIEVDLGGTPGYTASVTIFCYTNGVLITSRTFPNHVYGDTVAWDPAIYLVAGDILDVRTVASAKGATDVEGPENKTEVKGEIPPWNGKGGGAGVIHVREGADGDATGLNWTDAYPTLEGVTNLFANGNLPATYREIWIAGKILRAPHAMTDGDTSNTIIPWGPLNVRGGFDGHENAPEERTNDAARAMLDGAYACPGLLLSNGASSPVTVERIVFTRGVHMGLWKTGAGDITVRDCHFLNNTRTKLSSGVYRCGCGVGADLEGASGTTLAVVSNCVFEGNVFGTSGCDHGGGLYLGKLHQANLLNCLFLTNGIPFDATVDPYTGYGNGSRGAAIHANGAPIMAANCRFIGNRANEEGVNSSGEGGGTVVLFGACGGSSFVNCLWTGNEDAWTGYYNQNAASASDSGALMVMLGEQEQSVELRNCTVAYNYADRGYAGAGVTVHKGTVNIVDSILSGNFGGTVTQETVGRDLTLCSSNAVANVRYSLLGTPDGLSASAVDPETLSTNAADGVIFGDPCFVTPYAFVTNLIVSQGADRHSKTPHHRFSGAARDLLMGFNVHLRGGLGYRDESTGEVVTDYKSTELSPAIDSGDPASSRRNEARPHGPRVNMGFYGNTSWATMSNEPGLMLFVR